MNISELMFVFAMVCIITVCVVWVVKQVIICTIKFTEFQNRLLCEICSDNDNERKKDIE